MLPTQVSNSWAEAILGLPKCWDYKREALCPANLSYLLMNAVLAVFRRKDAMLCLPPVGSREVGWWPL